MFITRSLIDRSKVESFTDVINRYAAHFSIVWKNCTTGQQINGREYSWFEKRHRERIIKRFLNNTKEDLHSKKSCSLSQPDISKQNQEILKTLLADVLDFNNDHVELLIENNFFETTEQFIKAARWFDNSIGTIEIFQACRNLWTMNWIQLVLGLPVKMTPSVFAYSMLYPYTDNYLDDPLIKESDKKDFNERIYLKLSGEKSRPCNQREKIIFNLIGMIEDQYDRVNYPDVFDSLIAIHSAQIKSLKLMNPLAQPTQEQLLKISLEKGGTSVLADGYLVAGDLSEEQRIFLFGYGAYLQLVDDVQDTAEDLRFGFNTVYSSVVKNQPLDNLINRTFGFGNKILENFPFNVGQRLDLIIDMMKKSGDLLLIQSVGMSKEFYTKTYFKTIQKYSPVRYSFLKKHFKSIQDTCQNLYDRIEFTEPQKN
ncbi:MAG: hypothetical protein V1720_20155 [bacterium]